MRNMSTLPVEGCVERSDTQTSREPIDPFEESDQRNSCVENKDRRVDGS